MNNKVSVLMNGYNSEKYLKEAIDSIYSQTFENWEIVFIDNCSTDSTKKIVDSYDNKIKYYKTDKNIELGEARNFGLQYCDGEFLAFLDTDDIYLSNKLELQVSQLLENPDYQMNYTGGFFIDENSNNIKQFTPKAISGNVFPVQLKKYEINMQTVLIRNNQKIIFDNELEFSPDYDLFMKICSKHNVGVIKNPLVKYRKLNNSLTDKKINRWSIEMKKTLDNIFSNNPLLQKKYPKEHKMAYAKVAYYKARYLIKINQKINAIKCLSEYKYTNMVYYLLFALSIMPKYFWGKVHNNR
jgi:glycosyltransferase involved in cell wall biosynthesis